MSAPALRIGTILRLPWWTGSPRAVVVGFVRTGPSRVVLLGVGRGIRGRVMTLRRARVESRALYVGEARALYAVPCPCGARSCSGTVELRDALALLRRLRP